MSEAPVRWREDVGWEFRCEDCVARSRACFWPLSDEFWDPKRGMRRCRACYKAHDARRARERYAANTTVQERKRDTARRYYRETRKAQSVRAKERWLAIVADPELHARELARSRESSRRWRERQRTAA